MNDAIWGGAVEANFDSTDVIWVVKFSGSSIAANTAEFELRVGYLDVHVAKILAREWNKNPDNKLHPAITDGRAVYFAGHVQQMAFKVGAGGSLTCVSNEGLAVEVVTGLHVFRG